MNKTERFFLVQRTDLADSDANPAASKSTPASLASVPAPAGSDHAAECALYRRSGFRPAARALAAGQPHMFYSVVAVLRVLLLKGRNLMLIVNLVKVSL